MHENPTYFELRGYRVFVDLNEIANDGKKEKLTPKEMEVLVILYQNMGKTVSRQFLLESVWGERYANDLGLTQAISRLRQLFKDDRRAPSLIKTIPKKGYHLIAQTDAFKEDKADKITRNTIRWSRDKKILMFLILLLLIVLILFLTIKDIRIRVGNE